MGIPQAMVRCTASSDSRSDLVQLGSKESRAEFDVMFEELTSWKDTYHNTLVPKQVCTD